MAQEGEPAGASSHAARYPASGAPDDHSLSPPAAGEATESAPKVLILGNFRQTVTVIRSLARAGFAPIVGREEEGAFGAYSRYRAAVWEHPPVKQTAAFLAALVAFLGARHDIPFIFPVGETALRCLALHLEQIPRGVRVIMPPPTTLLTCLDKAQMYQLVAELGIPRPQSYAVADLSQLLAAAERTGYPCIVKPNDSLSFFFGKKVVLCHTAEEAREAFASWPPGNDFLLVQRYIAGSRPSCHFAAVRGKILAYFEHDVLRTDRADGTGYEVEGMSVAPTPVLRHYCVALVERLQYSGVGCVQFLASADSGVKYFLELNPRLDATCALPYRYGYDFPRLALDCLASLEGGSPSPPRVPLIYSPGKRVHWLLGDLYGLLQALAAGEVAGRGALRWGGKLLGAFTRADVHLTFWWQDPLPTGFLYAQVLRALWNRVRRYVVAGSKCPALIRQDAQKSKSC